MLKAEGIEDPTSPEAAAYFQSQDMDGFYRDIVSDNADQAGLLLETVALILGSITVQRVIQD